MRPLAAWIMRSRMHAAATSAVLCVLGWLLVPLMPLLSCMSGAAAALVTLRHGVLEGVMVAGLGGAILGAMSMFVHGAVTPALWVVLLIWLPAQLCGWVLRQTRNQGWTLVTTAAVAAVAAAAIRIATGDVIAWWRKLLDAVMQAAREQGGVTGITTEHLDAAARMLNSLVAASITVTLMLTVLLARHWQALLYNPGGFASEFRALQLPRLPVLAVLGVLLLALLMTQQWGVGTATLGYAVDLLAIAACALAFHGLALVHYECKRRQLAAGWLVGGYVLLLAVPVYVAMLLSALGLADVVLDFRSRAPSGSGKKGQ